jgi:hypothetical protein
MTVSGAVSSGWCNKYIPGGDPWKHDTKRQDKKRKRSPDHQEIALSEGYEKSEEGDLSASSSSSPIPMTPRELSGLEQEPSHLAKSTPYITYESAPALDTHLITPLVPSNPASLDGIDLRGKSKVL